jgi:hypothetical protein
MSVRGLVVGLVAGLFVLVFGAGSADAAMVYADTCGSLGAPSFCAPGPFALPFGVAVDGSGGLSGGDVYVASLNPGAGFVSRFTAGGEPAPFLGVNPNIAGNRLSGFGEAVGVAVDAATGAFVVTDQADAVVDRFTAAGEPEPSGTFGLPGGTVAVGVAVDNSGGPSNGDVYVSDEAGKVVDKFKPDGELVGHTTVEAEHPLDPYTLAVGPTGSVYVANLGGVAQKFSEALVFEGTLGESGSQSIAVDPDPASGDIYIGYGASVQEYSPAGAPIGSAFGSGVIGASYGLAVNGSTHGAYVSDLGTNDGIIFELGEAAEAPVTEPATAVTATTATLHGELNPGAATDKVGYYFAYNTGGTCTGGSTTTRGEVAEGNHTKVSLEVTGLQPSQHYTVCLFATSNVGGTEGSAVTFTTLALAPTVASVSVSSVKATEARLKAVVNPNNEPTEECRFEFGETTSYGSELPCEPASLEGYGDQGVGATATGLTAKTTYHYRIVVKNATGAAEGAGEFTTSLPPETPEKEEAKEITGTTVTLTGVLNPNAEGDPGTYEFRYKASAGACEGGAATPQGPAAGHTAEAASAPVTGLAPNTQYTFCLQTQNAAGETAQGPPVTFTTAEVAPTIGGESFSDVGSASVHLSAQVDDFGVLASYYYEYGTTTAYGSTTPTASIGTVHGAVTAPATLDGLQPHTLYHFRLIATSEAGATPGSDTTFTTLPAGSISLPDNRVYELVSPPDNHNADIDVPRRRGSFGANVSTGIAGDTVSEPFQAAASGDAVTYVGEPTTGGNGQGGPGGNQYLATRSPQGGWTQINVQPPTGFSPTYSGFSGDLSVGVLRSSEPLVADAPEAEFAYATAPGSESFEVLGELSFLNSYGRFNNGYGGGNAGTNTVPAFSHVLTYGPGGPTDSTAGRRVAVNILPDGETAARAVFGAPQVFNTREDGAVLDHVISADGSRIVWTDRSTGAIYVRENDTAPPSPVAEGKCTVAADACTVQVDAGASGGALFWTAGVDGSKVFFTDCSRLTASSTAVFTAGCGATPFGKLSGSDLYEFDVNSGEPIDLTVDHNGSDALGANVQGVVGESQDGSYVYFVATGNLAAGASAGEPNLYVTHAGVITFVTTLSFGDNGYESETGSGGGIGVWEQSLTDRTAQVAPDGRSLVFEANGEVYHYEVEHGAHVVCVSCSPSVEVSSLTAPVTVGAEGGFLPVTEDENTDTYQQRWISEDGSRVFFESSQALVPQDVNGVQDVYEWERDGSGTCRESPGCLYVLSGGTSTSWSSLLDASATGDDVFVITRAQLTPEDENDLFHVFDARVGGIRGLAPTTCSGTGCQGVPPAPPVFATPSSATFSGVGNYPPSSSPTGPTAEQLRAKALAKALKGCRKKHDRRKRTVCEKQVRKRFGPAKKASRSSKAKTASNDRRVGR